MSSNFVYLWSRGSRLYIKHQSTCAFIKNSEGLVSEIPKQQTVVDCAKCIQGRFK